MLRQHHQGDQLGVGRSRADPDSSDGTVDARIVISKSSLVTYSAVTRVSRSVSTSALQFSVGSATPILATLDLKFTAATPVTPLESPI